MLREPWRCPRQCLASRLSCFRALCLQGDLDVVSTTYVALNDGDGVMSATAGDSKATPIACEQDLYQTCKSASSMELSDYDASGSLDLIMRSHYMAADMVATNDGYGQEFTDISHTVPFAKHPHPTYGTIHAIDLDSDGDNDFVLVVGTTTEVYITSFCPSSARGPSGACFECPDFAVRSQHADRCVECPAHHMASGSSACAPCPAGSERPLGSDECTLCPTGMASTGGGAPCVPCAVGRYGDSPGRTDLKCTGACHEGHYCAAGSTSAYPPACAVGYYLEESSSVNGTSVACVACDDSVMDCSVPGVCTNQSRVLTASAAALDPPAAQSAQCSPDLSSTC